MTYKGTEVLHLQNGVFSASSTHGRQEAGRLPCESETPEFATPAPAFCLEIPISADSTRVALKDLEISRDI